MSRLSDQRRPNDGLARGLRIETITSKLPPTCFSGLGGIDAVRVGIAAGGSRKTKNVSNVIGQWVPTLLIQGLCNKLVKVAGSD